MCILGAYFSAYYFAYLAYCHLCIFCIFSAYNAYCQHIILHIILHIIWNLAKPDIGVFPDIGSPTDTISGHMSRYRGFLLTRYRDMSHVTRYRVPISGTYPISGHHGTDIVNHIPDIGINIGYNIRCPDIGDMISRYRCQYRVPISGVPISGYDSHRYRSQYRTRYRVLFLVQMQGPARSLW